jgi:polar amino acid transport system substrate-binding protein
MFDDVVKSKLSDMGLQPNDIRKGKLHQKSDIYVAFSKSKNTRNAMKMLDKGLKKTHNQK